MQGTREADVTLLGVHGDTGLGTVADPPARSVEDASHADGVVLVGEHAQIRNEVTDLLALVESDAADDLVRQSESDEDLFECTRGVVGSVEDGHLVEADVSAVDESVDLRGHERRLVVLVVGDVADDQLALAGVGPQLLLASADVA